MPRTAAIVFLMLSYSPAMAGQSLPAGKPAGVKRAQNITNDAIAIGALAVMAGVGAVLISHPYKIPGTAASPSTQP
jgi:hypothetical protein